MSRAKRLSQLFVALILAASLLPGFARAQVASDIIIYAPELKDVDDALQLGLYFTVVDNSGRVIPNARVASARIQLDDGQVADPAALEKPTAPFYIALVLDASGSMSPAAIRDAMLQAALGAVDSAPEEARFALIKFDDAVTTLVDFTDDRNRVKNEIAAVKPRDGAGTCLYDALFSAIGSLSTLPPGRRAVVLFSDGKDQVLGGAICSKHTYDEVVTFATQTNVRVPINIIGMQTRDLNASELRQMAEETNGFVEIGAQAELPTLFGKIMEALKSQFYARGLFYPRAGSHTATLTARLEDGTLLTESIVFEVPRDYAVPITPTFTPTPIVIDIEILSVEANIAQEQILVEVAATNQSAISDFRFDLFDKQTNQRLDQVIIPAPLPQPVIINANKLQGDIRIELRALDAQGNFMLWPGERNDMLDKATFEFSYRRPTPTPPPASPTPVNVEVELDPSVGYEPESDTITLFLSLTGSEQITALEIIFADADTGARTAVYPDLRPSETLSVRATGELVPQREYLIYVKAETTSGRDVTSERVSFVYPKTPTPTPTSTPTATATATPKPVLAEIKSIIPESTTEQLVIVIAQEADERVASYELQLLNADTGFEIGRFVRVPPQNEFRIPLSSLPGGKYSAILSALGPTGSVLAKTQKDFTYNPPVPPTATPPPTETPSPTPTPEPGLVDRVTGTVRDNPAVALVIAVIAFALLLVLFLLLRPRKKQPTGTGFLSAQTGFYQMPTPGDKKAELKAPKKDKPDIAPPSSISQPPPAVAKTDIYPAATMPIAELQITRSPAMARLGSSVVVRGVPFTIGRAVEGVDSLSLDEDTGVSRKHAELDYQNQTFYLTDLGSSNGTFVNGVRLAPQKPTAVQNGAQIVLGKNTELILLVAGGGDPDKTYVQHDPDRTDYQQLGPH